MMNGVINEKAGRSQLRLARIMQYKLEISDNTLQKITELAFKKQTRG